MLKIDQVIDILMKNKDKYRNHIFFGVKRIISPGDTKNVFTFQTFFRVNDNDDIELLCCDIKDVKLIEEINADTKYKTIFLSKVAHEFKNPLITISELIKKNYQQISAGS